MLFKLLLAHTLPFTALSWSIRHPFPKAPSFNSIDHHSYDDTNGHPYALTYSRLELPEVFQLNILAPGLPGGPSGIRLIRDESFPGPDYPYPVLAPPHFPDSPHLILRDSKIWIKDSNLVFGRFQVEDRSLNPKKLMFGDPNRMIPLEFEYQDGDDGWALYPKRNFASGRGIVVIDRRLFVQLLDGKFSFQEFEYGSTAYKM
jgi:hypothetical protein